MRQTHQAVLALGLVAFAIGHFEAVAQNRSALSDPGRRAKEVALVGEIRTKILANSKETAAAEMQQYEVKLPMPGKANVSSSGLHPRPFSMIPIKGGRFIMGDDGPKAGSKESPAHPVTLAPFWMQECEVTWNEYEPFMLQTHREGGEWKADPTVDAVAYPTKPYLEMSFGMGKDGYPAISMTQHAANKYCQWLSARTGHFYRLPTEAEWEYACRAGSDTQYSFGDDPAELGKYAWFEENSTFKYQRVGKKLPNPWGLYDMHGNVAEWTLDRFAAYEKTAVTNPWSKSVNTYPHVVRGGSWADEAKSCRSASRRPSSGFWNADNALPKSSWHLTHTTVGFRVVRPLKVPTADEMFNYWNNQVEIDASPMPPEGLQVPTE